MESSATSGLSTNQKSIYDRFKNVSASSCFKCGGKNTLPAAYGEPESDYRAVENKGVLKFGGKTKASKNAWCKICSAFV